jgi:YHS domain-containing protein
MMRGNLRMILRWVIGIIVIYLLYRMIRKGFPAVGDKPGSARIQTPTDGEELVEDPLCHTYVPLSQAFRTEIDGKTVYFCSQKCLEQYGKK